MSAVQWAIDDFGGKVNGKPVVLLVADSQLKPDVASAITRKWIVDDKIDAVISGAGSAISLAAMDVAKQRGIAVLNTGGLSSDLSGKFCSDLATHWNIDTAAAARMSARAGSVAGSKKWFFITADYSFGQALQRDTEAEIAKNDGVVLGSVKAPFGAADFSMFLLEAQASGADTIALANAGNDTTNSLKQANEFGMGAGRVRLIGTVTSITDVHSIGLEVAQGFLVSESFYWDRDDSSRAFPRRFEQKFGRVPTQSQAVGYSAMTHFLRAAQAVGTTDGRSVTAQMKTMPVRDFYAIDGTIREDGRMIPKYIYALEAKKPQDSKSEWDLYAIRSLVPGDQAYPPLAESACPLVRR